MKIRNEKIMKKRKIKYQFYDEELTKSSTWRDKGSENGWFFPWNIKFSWIYTRSKTPKTYNTKFINKKTLVSVLVKSNFLEYFFFQLLLVWTCHKEQSLEKCKGSEKLVKNCWLIKSICLLVSSSNGIVQWLSILAYQFGVQCWSLLYLATSIDTSFYTEVPANIPDQNWSIT